MENKSDSWRFWLLTGVVAALVYIAHTIVGDLLWSDYSAVKQAISDLTADSAPNASMLRIFTTVYGVLTVVFSVSLWQFLKGKFNQFVNWGTIFMVVLFTVSFLGYMLFPLDGDGASMNFQNVMHIVVTAIVVLSTILSLFLLGIGLLRYPTQKKLSTMLLVATGVIVASGASIGIVLANQLDILGIVERINIYTLQIVIAVLSIHYYRYKDTSQ